MMFVDHPRSGVVYNFSTLCDVCMNLCNTMSLECLDVGSLFSHIQYISRVNIRIMFVYEGHRVKINVIGPKRSKIPIPAM